MSNDIIGLDSLESWEKEVAWYEGVVESLTTELKECREQLAARDAEVERLRDAVLFYANEENYNAVILCDNGETARQALNGDD